jgi:predicted O-methyltransferase YrrM
MRLAQGKKKAFVVDYPHSHVKAGTVSTYSAVEALFEKNSGEFLKTLSEFTTYLPDLRKMKAKETFMWVEGGMFPPLDIISTYCMVRAHKPARILEIGSGTSSHVSVQALKDNGIGEMTCIDPQPRSSIEALDITFKKQSLSEGDVEAIQYFEANDILFIDSSHLMYPGFDTDIEFNRMFPELPKGAIVHVHDIFLPDDYPHSWFDRRYSEQNALIGWILSGYFDVVFPAFYLATRMSDKLEDAFGDLMPNNPSENAGSIWLRKN